MSQSKVVDAWMKILQEHADGAMSAYRGVIEKSVAANKQTHDPPSIALSIAEHTDVAAFVIVGMCPTTVAAESVCEHFKRALDSSLKAEGR